MSCFWTEYLLETGNEIDRGPLENMIGFQCQQIIIRGGDYFNWHSSSSQRSIFILCGTTIFIIFEIVPLGDSRIFGLRFSGCRQTARIHHSKQNFTKLNKRRNQIVYVSSSLNGVRCRQAKSLSLVCTTIIFNSPKTWATYHYIN